MALIPNKYVEYGVSNSKFSIENCKGNAINLANNEQEVAKSSLWGNIHAPFTVNTGSGTFTVTRERHLRIGSLEQLLSSKYSNDLGKERKRINCTIIHCAHEQTKEM